MARDGDAGLRRRRRVRAWTIAQQPIDDAERGEIIFDDEEHSSLDTNPRPRAPMSHADSCSPIVQMVDGSAAPAATTMFTTAYRFRPPPRKLQVERSTGRVPYVIFTVALSR